MTTDHSDFIARQQEADHRRRAAGEGTPRATMLTVALFLMYISICLIVALVLDIDRATMMVAALAFLMATILGVYIQARVQEIRGRNRQSEILRQVLEGSRGARLVTDGADNQVYANEKFIDLCHAPELTGLEALAALFGENTEARGHFRLLAEQARRGLTDTVELMASSPEGDRFFAVAAQPVAGWAGHIHWRIDDVTAQRMADRGLREEREKLIDFTDNAPVGFFSIDEGGRFLFVNATFARWVGEDISTLLNEARLHTYLVDVPEDAPPYDLTGKGGSRQIAEVKMKGPGGRTFLASVSQVIVREADGRVRTRAVVHDLTAERAMRQAVQAAEDRFQRFFEEAPLGIALIDSQGTLNDCNNAFAQILGVATAEIEGRQFPGLIREDDRDTVLAAIGRIGQGQQIAPMEICLLGREGEVAVQMHARKFKGSDSIVLHFIDLTQQKALETQFVQSQKMQAIGQLAGGVAHDFNNLLTAMIGFCDLLLLRHKPGDPSFADLMQIKQNANRAANLVRQLLAFSRQQTLRPRVQDITDILTEISHLLRRLIGANIELQLVHGQNLGLVKVDEGQMEQVLINLAVNARDAMEGGGRLTISTAHFENARPVKRGGDEMPPGQWVCISVRDTGCGIPQANLSRIFEPFFTTKEVGQGTGLGLATVYGIIRQTGGYLDVESGIDEGTTFSIYLPRASEAEAEATVEAATEEETRDLTGTARILLVEDEDAVRTFSSRALVNKGYEVLAAESGEAALELMAAQEDRKIDLMVTDVVMPNMDGPTLARRMREENPNLKIIFISGYTEDKLKDHMGENVYFLPKPFTLKQLAAKVKAALEE